MGESGLVGTDWEISNVTIDISHTWDGDLSINLVSPSGASLNLSQFNGGSLNNYTNTVFVDGAPSITTGSAPFTGQFSPEGGTFADTFEVEEPVDLEAVSNELQSLESDLAYTDKSISDFCKELNIKTPF